MCCDFLDIFVVFEGSDIKISFKDKEKINFGNLSVCSFVYYDYGQDDFFKNLLYIGYTLN